MCVTGLNNRGDLVEYDVDGTIVKIHRRRGRNKLNVETNDESEND
jgi:hypothetical protein